MPVHALLLLAGRSTRFWPLSEKTLFPLCGTTLLHHQVQALKDAGWERITLVGGKHNIEAAHLLFPDLPIVEQEDLEKGMQGALLSALPQFGNEPVMVVSGNDVVESSAYRTLREDVEKKGVEGAILAQRRSTYFPGGYLTLTGDRVSAIVEKPGEGNEPSDLVTIVAHVHTKPAELLKLLQSTKSEKDDGYERALHELFQTHTYHAVPYTGFWQAVKYPWHMLSLLPYFLSTITKSHIDTTAEIHPSAVISGNVIIGPRVRVMAHATIAGPCFIGADSVVANNALVRGSSVGERCIVGYCTEVKGSVLASDVWTHMTYLGDSVVGRNVSFGAGTVTGNFRLDEAEVQSKVGEHTIGTGLTKCGAFIGENCRIGIHVSMNPGIKIGAGSFVSSATLVSEDIPEQSFVRMKCGQLTVSENRSPPPSLEQRSEYYRQVKAKGA